MCWKIHHFFDALIIDFLYPEIRRVSKVHMSVFLTIIVNQTSISDMRAYISVSKIPYMPLIQFFPFTNVNHLLSLLHFIFCGSKLFFQVKILINPNSQVFIFISERYSHKAIRLLIFLANFQTSFMEHDSTFSQIELHTIHRRPILESLYYFFNRRFTSALYCHIICICIGSYSLFLKFFYQVIQENCK